MPAKKTFDYAMGRAQHFLTLYDILHDSRQRGVRSDWMAKFKDLMRWPSGEQVVRIDGKDKKSLLILREDLGIDRSRFAHEYTSELLRAAIVAAISALDRYMHDLIVRRSLQLLKQSEDDVPKRLRDLRIPVLTAQRAIQRIREDKNTRPGHLVKQEIQKILHREHTFQNADSVQRGADMLGIKGFWDKVSAEMPGSPEKKDVIDTLNNISRRRNQIVHEADLILHKQGSRISHRPISHKETSDFVSWIDDFGNALDKVVT